MRLKLGKAAGIDKISMKAWRYGGKAVKTGEHDKNSLEN